MYLFKILQQCAKGIKIFKKNHNIPNVFHVSEFFFNFNINQSSSIWKTYKEEAFWVLFGKWV